MDVRSVVTIAGLLLTALDASFSQNNQTIHSPNQTSVFNCTCCSATNASSVAPTSNSSKHNVMNFLTINWTSKCEGDVIFYHPSNSSHVCYETQNKTLLTNSCRYRKGCEGTERWVRGRNKPHGYVIIEHEAEQRSPCDALMVRCKVEVIPNLQGQLQTYKVMTVLLCCVLVIILLLRFTRPTVKALQKRLSDRRQNRWIGPTQSHSVSYHRGKTVKNNEGEKRLSFAALERLTVSDSREPSSNRNSDYNL